MKYQLLAFLLLVAGAASGQERFRITHGPYLQHLDQNSVTIVWTTNKEAVSWIELAPLDSAHFYLKERPKFFSARYGFKDVSKIPSIRLSHPAPVNRYR